MFLLLLSTKTHRLKHTWYMDTHTHRCTHTQYTYLNWEYKGQNSNKGTEEEGEKSHWDVKNWRRCRFWGLILCRKPAALGQSSQLADGAVCIRNVCDKTDREYWAECCRGWHWTRALNSDPCLGLCPSISEISFLPPQYKLSHHTLLHSKLMVVTITHCFYLVRNTALICSHFKVYSGLLNGLHTPSISIAIS